MRTTIRHVISTLAAAFISLVITGCGLENQTAPSLIGPSEYGLFVRMEAVPDQLPRDGSSQSVITVTVRDVQDRPVSGQRLSVGTNAGAVSESQIVTDSAGRATFAYVSPTTDVAVESNVAIVQVAPVGSDFGNVTPRIVLIRLTGMSNTTAPTPSFTISPTAPTLMQNVVFDASATTDEGVRCEDACTYSWDFGGESTGTGRVANYRFRTARTYAVKVTVTDAAGSQASLTQNVTIVRGNLPEARIAVSPNPPVILETVSFSGEGSTVGETGRTITQWDWQFGDGTSATGVRVSKTYSIAATYRVVLTVTDSAGVQATNTQDVIVGVGVTADFTFSPTNPTAGQTIILNAEASKGSSGFGGRNPITSYIWNFGTSESTTTTTTPITSTSFATGGARVYTVNLTVVDSAGRRGTTSKTITVN